MKEHEAARAWREKHGLTQQQVADMTGYSREAVFYFEQGRQAPRNGKRKPHAKEAWHRYKMACAGIDAQIRSKKAFEWGKK